MGRQASIGRTYSFVSIAPTFFIFRIGAFFQKFFPAFMPKQEELLKHVFRRYG